MRKIMLAATASALTSAFASNPEIANATLQTPAPTPAAAAAPKAPRVDPVISGVAVVAMPERKTGGRGAPSPYPFDTLEVGQAFGVKNKDKRGMSSIVSNANRKNKQTANGADGQPVTIVGKSFTAFDVDADTKKAIKGTALEGSTVLVFRTK